MERKLRPLTGKMLKNTTRSSIMQNKRNGDNSMGEGLSQARRSSHDIPQEQGATVWSKQLFVLL